MSSYFHSYPLNSARRRSQPRGELLEDLPQGLDLVEHPGHLSGHQASRFGVPVKDSPAQAAQGVLLELHHGGAGPLFGDIGAGHLILQDAYRGAGDPAVTMVPLSLAFRMACL